MNQFYVDTPLPSIPTDLSIPQFIFDTNIVQRPARPSSVPFFIEDATGRKVYKEEAKERSYDLANAFHLKWSIGNEDVVCLLSPNDVDYTTAMWATHLLGGIVTPGNPSYTVDELSYQLTTTKTVLLVTHPVCLHTAIAAAKKCGLSESRIVVLKDTKTASQFSTLDSLITFGATEKRSFVEKRFKEGETKKALAFLSLSSGTTGRPKAVAISHYGVIANIIQKATHWKINDPTWPNKFMNPGDVAIGVLPFFHIYGLIVNLHYQLYSGLSIVVIPKFNFVQFLDSIAKYRITHLYLVPPHIVLLCKQEAVKNYDFSHVKFCMSGAAPLSGELYTGLRKLLPNAAIGQGYGLTETCTSVSLMPPETKYCTAGSSGRLIPGVQARVIKEDGTFANEGEQGELVVYSPSLALGYLNNEAATKETFVESWVRTGDEVIIKNNEVFIVDRLKEIMKVRGFQVAPAELEGHLLLHPDVSDACVVSIPDDYSGELPLAYVVLSTSARAKANPKTIQEMKDALFKHVSDVKVQYKWLTGGIEFIDAIPKNPSGKILRRVLREQARKLPRPVKAKL